MKVAAALLKSCSDKWRRDISDGAALQWVSSTSVRTKGHAAACIAEALPWETLTEHWWCAQMLAVPGIDGCGHLVEG